MSRIHQVHRAGVLGLLGQDDCPLGEGVCESEPMSSGLAQSLFDEITAIHHGEAEDVFGWMVPVS